MGDSRWETIVSQGTTQNEMVSDNLIKCPCCGKIGSYKSEKCKNCGFNFKTHLKSKCPRCGKPICNKNNKCQYCGYTTKIISKTEKRSKAIFVRKGLVKCPKCGWNQSETNEECNFCDFKFF